MPVTRQMKMSGHSKAMEYAQWTNLTLFLLATLLPLSGCVTDSVNERRIARYRPDVGDKHDSAPPRTGRQSAGNTAATRQTQRVEGTRVLKLGDKVSIYLRDIPTPENINEVIDDLGGVNLPLIGAAKIEGMTTSKAESLIKNAYTKGGYYKRITVIIVPEDDEYFIRGEVKNEGKYRISRELTLIQALAQAGGYTDYAKESEIKVIRGNQTFIFDAAKIEKGKEQDPLINPGDIIIVQRRRY